MKRVIAAAFVFVLLLCAGVSARAQWDKDVFSFRGRSALAEGRLAEAITNFNILAQLDSTDYYTFFFRGLPSTTWGISAGPARISIRPCA